MPHQAYYVEVDIMPSGIVPLQAAGFTVDVLEECGPGGGNPFCRVWAPKALLLSFLYRERYGADVHITTVTRD